MDSYEINEFGEVVPYISGRRSNNTREWREATELELQQRTEIAELEEATRTLQQERDEAVECVRTLRNKLAEYADKDGVAHGYGAGCMSNPDEYIKEELRRADAILAKHGGES